MKKNRLLLIFALIFSLVFFCSSTEKAIASHGNNSDYFYELLSDGTVQIMHYRGHAAHLTVPAEIEGCPVTVIDTSAFSGKQELQEVVLPDTLRHLEDGARLLRIIPDFQNTSDESDGACVCRLFSWPSMRLHPRFCLF